MSEIQEVEVNQSVYKRVTWAFEAAREVASQKDGWQAECSIDEIRLCTSGYAEPGYTDPECGVVAVGNWNTITRYNKETGKHDVLDNTAERLAKVLDKLGVELEWSDEWSECHECYRIVRTSPDSYGWTPSYYVGDGFLVCLDCIDPEEYLKELEGETTRCNTVVEDITEHGYHHIETFERGFHRGQDADPDLISKIMRAHGFYRFLFNIESQGQFDTRFGLYLHDEEAEDGGLERAKEAIESGRTDGPSVSGALERSLKEVSRQQAEAKKEGVGDGIIVSQVGLDGAKTRVISPQDFIEGKALDWTEEE